MTIQTVYFDEASPEHTDAAFEAIEVFLREHQEIRKVVVATTTGTTGAAWVQENLIDTELMDEENLKLYDLYIDAVADLDIGPAKLDAIVLDLPVAQAFAENPNREVAYTILTGEHYGFGVKKGFQSIICIRKCR